MFRIKIPSMQHNTPVPILQHTMLTVLIKIVSEVPFFHNDLRHCLNNIENNWFKEKRDFHSNLRRATQRLHNNICRTFRKVTPFNFLVLFFHLRVKASVITSKVKAFASKLQIVFPLLDEILINIIQTFKSSQQCFITLRIRVNTVTVEMCNRRLEQESV